MVFHHTLPKMYRFDLQQTFAAAVKTKKLVNRFLVDKGVMFNPGEFKDDEGGNLVLEDAMGAQDYERLISKFEDAGVRVEMRMEQLEGVDPVVHGIRGKVFIEAVDVIALRKSLGRL